MGKSYLRYAPQATFGVVASSGAAALFDTKEPSRAIVPALERIAVWGIRNGMQACSLGASDEHSQVTALAASPTPGQYAAGHESGTVRVWDTKSETEVLTLSGHKKAVISLQYSPGDGNLLASGSRDTVIIIWDVVAQTGLFRLRGHSDAITSLVFLRNGASLLSSSLDTLVKCWDLDAQHCIHTLVGHRSGGIWSMAVDKEEKFLVTGSTDSSIRVWTIPEDIADGEFESLGHVKRVGGQRVQQLQLCDNRNLLVCASSERAIDFFRFHDKDEREKRRKRREKRAKEKKKQKGEDGGDDDDNEEKFVLQASDVFSHVHCERLRYKVRAVDLRPPVGAKPLEVLVTLSANALETLAVSWNGKKNIDVEHRHLVDAQGHRSDVRAVALSSDDQMIASGSAESVRIWNTKSGRCIVSMESSYIVSLVFVPDDQHVIAGTKDGHIEVFDISAAVCVERVEAHAGSVWSLHLGPDGSTLYSASADKTVKIWELQVVEERKGDSGLERRLGLESKQVVEMEDEVLCVRLSSDGKYLAMSLLDSTIRILFADSLRLYLSLYGHKLPAMSLDFSSDSLLLASGSADKNVKIWSLDFGNCLRSIFAHDESIMTVRFIPDTHYILSASKDGTVRFFDGDKFVRVMSITGHHGEVWALDVSKQGDLFVTGSHDRSIRVWQQTDEPVFLEEEREREMDEVLERDLDRPVDGEKAATEGAESSLAGKKHGGTARAAESLVDAIQVAEEERNQMEQHAAECEERRQKGEEEPAAPQSNVLLLGRTPSEHVYAAFSAIRSADVEQALLVIPYSIALTFLRYCGEWLRQGRAVESVSRAALFLVRVHNSQLSTTRDALDVLTDLHTHMREQLVSFKDTLGYNLAALRHVQKRAEDMHSTRFFDAPNDARAKRAKIASP